MASIRAKKRRHYRRVGTHLAASQMEAPREAIPSPLYAVLMSALHDPHRLLLVIEALITSAARRIANGMEQDKQARTRLRD